MTGFLQATVYGLLQGGLLALVAVGFSLVWGVMNVVNLSHGAFVVLGAYVGWQLNTSLGLAPFLGMGIDALVPVPYTHLKLPTSDLGSISVVAVSLKKKKRNKGVGGDWT